MAPLNTYKVQLVVNVYDAPFSQSASNVSRLTFFRKKIVLGFGVISAFANLSYIAIMSRTVLFLIFLRFMVNSLRTRVYTYSVCDFIANIGTRQGKTPLRSIIFL